MTNEPQFLSIREAVDILHLSRPTIHRRIKDGEIPSTKIGARVLIPVNFVNQLLDKSMGSVKHEK